MLTLNRFPLFFLIVVCWAIQIQAQLQIIINRLSVIWCNRRRAAQLRWGVFLFFFAIIIVVGNIWIPMALQIDGAYVFECPETTGILIS